MKHSEWNLSVEKQSEVAVLRIQSSSGLCRVDVYIYDDETYLVLETV